MALSYVEIVSKLQIANCCLSQKGIEAIECQKKGKTPDYSDIILMRNLINSLKSCISAQAILPAPAIPIPGIPAIPVPSVPYPVSPIKDPFLSADPVTIQFEIKDADGTDINYPDLVIPLADRTKTLAYHIAYFMNCQAKQWGYTAREYNYIYLAIFGYQYEDDNGYTFKLIAQDNGNKTTLIETIALVGGVAHCCPSITETLEKLDRLCNKPCNEIVNTF